MKNIITKAIIEGIRSRKDRSLGLSISTPELSVQEKAIFMELQGINVDLTITPIDVEEAPTEYKVNADLNTKTPSIRLRNVMYILWQQNNEGHDIFDTYYELKMNGIIEHLKAKIDE